jgi:hypothetical protein
VKIAKLLHAQYELLGKKMEKKNDEPGSKVIPPH